MHGDAFSKIFTLETIHLAYFNCNNACNSSLVRYQKRYLSKMSSIIQMTDLYIIENVEESVPFITHFIVHRYLKRFPRYRALKLDRMVSAVAPFMNGSGVTYFLARVRTRSSSNSNMAPPRSQWAAHVRGSGDRSVTA